MRYVSCLGLEFKLYYSLNKEILERDGGTPYLDIAGKQYYSPLSDYFILLGHYYLKLRGTDNIDNWLFFINRQLWLKDNQEYFGDNVCVFFQDDKVRLINNIDYESGKENYCEMTVQELLKLTIEWKWFVIDWEMKQNNAAR